MDYAILSLIAIIFLARETSTYKQTKQMQGTIDKLSDKLMSKDFKEYKELTQPVQVFEPVAVTEQEEYYREIEEMKV